MSLNNWQPVIGLEVHVQLATRTKLFSSSPIAFGAEPNTQASEIDLGLPGVLPVLNKEAISHALKFGCAINAEISVPSAVSSDIDNFVMLANVPLSN